MRVIVDYQSYLEHSYRSPEQWGEWNEDHSFDILGVRVADENEKLPYGREGYLIPDGSTHAHVLWMRYSTGDSFGRSEGNGAIIGVFGDRKVAELATAAVKKQEDEYTIRVKDDLGRMIQIDNPGAGYFESVDSINLDSFDLGMSPIRLTK